MSGTHIHRYPDGVRGAVALHVVVLCVQLAAALAFVAGSGAAFQVHSWTAYAVVATGAIQAICVFMAKPPRWIALVALGTVVGEGAQVWLGLTARVAEHLTLGLVVWGLALTVWIRIWAPTPR